jgi:lysyl-tRNA synthetase class 2
MAETNDRREQRIINLERLRDGGIEPYPARVPAVQSASEALAAYAAGSDAQPTVTVAGRLVALRIMGKSAFAHLVDGTGRIQVYLRRDLVGEESYELFRRGVDLGDFVSAQGELFLTRTGEITVQVSQWTFLSKALRPLPEKWHGLKDVELRYRQRYLDLVANQSTRDIFLARTRIISAIRRFLDGRGFLEVETPVLQPLYGGAAARPFITHHNTLDRTLYLRIADELYLKRLIVGGFDRVYEIAHNFRNEGIDTQHNPEFTAMELYQAYADYHDMMRIVEELYHFVATEVFGSSTLTFGEHQVDLTPPWRRVTMRDAILEASGLDIEALGNHAALWAAVQAANLQVPPQDNWGKLVAELFEALVEPTLIRPTFLLDFPIDISPLAKKKPGSERFVERFEFFVAGMESGNAFTELNDPLDQRERFVSHIEAVAKGDEDAHPLDEDFLLAMEHGMPPTGGLGIGIDRMVMQFTNQSSIREVILFPQMRD